MGILHNIKYNLDMMKKNSKRFIVTVLLAMVFGGLLIYLDKVDYNTIGYKKVKDIIKVVFLATIFSLDLGLFIETRENQFKLKIGLYGGLGILSLLYYKYMLGDSLVLNNTYIGLVLIGFLLMVSVARFNISKGHEFYVVDIFKGFGLTFVYSVVLYLGISSILATITNLFDLNMKGNVYYYIFIIIVSFFAPTLFISRLPRDKDSYEDRTLSRAFNSLIEYILIPLISIYSLILYVYFLKILISRNWPKGLVSHLVLWYSMVSIGVLFFIRGIGDKGKIISCFRKYFPRLNLPILFMMFISLYKRLNQYGFTENRYYVLMGGLWILFIMAYHIIRDDENNLLTPVSLVVVIVISLVGPVNGFRISKNSQNKRFEKILRENDMLKDGRLIENKSIRQDAEIEISNIIGYFDENHRPGDIKLFPGAENKKEIVESLGIEYRVEILGLDGSWIGYSQADDDKPVEISGYDYIFKRGSWKRRFDEIGIYKVHEDDGKLIIEKDGKEDMVLSIRECLEDIIELDSEDIVVDKEYVYVSDQGLKFKIVFTNFSGSVGPDKKISIESYSYDLLLEK